MERITRRRQASNATGSLGNSSLAALVPYTPALEEMLCNSEPGKVYMSARNLPSIHSSKSGGKPLSRLQAYLVELEVCLGLLRKVLLELKEVAFVIVMILFFIWSAVQLFKGIH